MIKRDTAGGVIINDAGEVVMVFASGNSWQLPKGGVEPGEDRLQTAKREIEEETGLTELIYVKSCPPYTRMSGEGDKFMTISYFMFRVKKQSLRPSMEVSKCEWVPIDQVANKLTYKEDQEFFRGIQDELAAIH